jgi:uncharacterized protein
VQRSVYTRPSSHGRRPSILRGLRLPPAFVGLYTPGVRRAEAIEFFASHRDELRRLGINSLLVFGSVARDEARPDSDLDLIAEFNRPIGYLGLARVQHELERLLGCRVDLATPGMFRPEQRDRILGEAVRAA